MNSNIDLTSGWDTLWASIVGATGQTFTNVLTVVGVALMIFAAGKWIWSRRTGRGNSNDVTYSMVFGALLAGPQVVIPLILTFFELVINLGVGVFSGVVS